MSAQDNEESQEVPQAVEVETVGKTDSSLQEDQEPDGEEQASDDLPSSINIEIKPEFTTTNTTDNPENTSQKTTEGNEPWWTLTLADSLTALFMLALVVFNCLLWRSTHKMWRATEQSANAAEKSAKAALFSTSIVHRPRIIIRLIRLGPDEQFVEYEIANVGEAKAEIIAIYADVYTIQPIGSIGSSFPDVPPFTNDRNVEGLFLHAGEYQQRTIPLDINRGWELAFSLAFDPTMGPNSQGEHIMFMGYIVYRDVSVKIARRTAFQRIYSTYFGRFVPMDNPDPDYEHAD